jgi:hypothetical protein
MRATRSAEATDKLGALMPARLKNRTFRRLSLLGGAVLIMLGTAACGQISHPTEADNEGVYVDAGPLTYQVQISRELNQFNIEDKEYLKGVNSPAPGRNEEWFAVFLWAKNQTQANHVTTDSFDIVDTTGKKYFPISIDSAVNPYAWVPQTLKPLGTEPAPDSTAYFGPTQGGELLFKLEDSVYSSRPITLEIHAAGQDRPSTISLDL